jgi:hypothetical protein
VELTGDGGGKDPALARTLRGRNRVASTLINSLLSGRVPGVSLRRAEVNGGPGALYLDAQERMVAVVALDIDGGQIRRINSIVNPDKLTHLGPVADFASLLKSARSTPALLPPSPGRPVRTRPAGALKLWLPTLVDRGGTGAAKAIRHPPHGGDVEESFVLRVDQAPARLFQR